MVTFYSITIGRSNFGCRGNGDFGDENRQIGV